MCDKPLYCPTSNLRNFEHTAFILMRAAYIAVLTLRNLFQKPNKTFRLFKKKLANGHCSKAKRVGLKNYKHFLKVKN